MNEATDTRMRPADLGAVRQAGDPRVSPDGSLVAFTVTDPDVAANRYTRRIWLVRADGGSPARPLSGTGAAFLPRWSPDGTRLALAATDADGTHTRGCACSR